MTGKQLEAARQARAHLKRWHDRDEELSCIGMIHSILVYNYHPESENFTFPKENRYLRDYIVTLGLEKVQKLWEEQVEDYRHAEVTRGVWTDAEGCIYYSCRWADE